MASKTFLSKYSNQIYGLMRMVIGILFFSHGVQKASALLSGAMSFNNTLIVLACIIELAAGFMIIVGLQTRWAAFIASGEMAVAYFKAHASHGFWPINNGGEKAVFYCFLFLFIASYGAGAWSIDKK